MLLTTKTDKTFTIYTRKLAYELRLRGFDIVGLVPDKCKPYLDNYLFENTAEFQAAYQELTANKAKLREVHNDI